MSLRDWFAGQVLAGLASQEIFFAHKNVWEAPRLAYSIADAMIEERKEKD